MTRAPRFAAFQLRLRFAIAAAVSAAAMTTVAGTLRMEEWLPRALENDPELREWRAEAQYDLRRSERVPVWEDPELRLGYESREERGNQTVATLRMDTPNPWEAGAIKRRERARAGATAAQLELAESLRAVELSELYVEAYFLQHAVRVESELNASLHACAETAAAQRRERIMTRVDYLDLMGEIATSDARLAELQAELAHARGEIDALAGLEPDPSRTLLLEQPLPPDSASIPSAPALLAYAIEHHPSSELFHQLRAEAKAEGDEAKAAGIPWFSFIEASWVSTDESDRDDWEGQVGITLPVFSWIRGVDHEARRRTERRNALESVAEERLRSEIAASHARVSADWQRWQAMESSSAPLLAEIDQTLSGDAPLPTDDRVDLLKLQHRLGRERLASEEALRTSLLRLQSSLGGEPVPFLPVPR